MHAVIFLPAAQIEARDAQDWYEAQTTGLGHRFRAELDHAVQRLSFNPFQFPTVFTDIRRALLRRFPYALFFRIVDDAVFVLACFHSSRDPRTWQRRGFVPVSR
jgi:plasmid stabilization system protein ParE